MLATSHKAGWRSAAALLSITMLLSSCSSEDGSDSNGPNAGASGQAGASSESQGGAATSSGGNSSNVGGVTLGSGGLVASAGGAVARGGASTTVGGAGVSCSQSQVTCNMITPSCPAMQVPELTANGSCYTNNCIPIGSCVCLIATDCPDNDQYTCNNSTKRCTPYLL